jgi:hypothetical protein
VNVDECVSERASERVSEEGWLRVLEGIEQLHEWLRERDRATATHTHTHSDGVSGVSDRVSDRVSARPFSPARYSQLYSLTFLLSGRVAAAPSGHQCHEQEEHQCHEEDHSLLLFRRCQQSTEAFLRSDMMPVLLSCKSDCMWDTVQVCASLRVHVRVCVRVRVCVCVCVCVYVYVCMCVYVSACTCMCVCPGYVCV